MNLTRALSVAAGLVLAAAGVVGVSQPASATLPLPLPTPSTCLIQTFNTGNFLTAVGGGGRTTDVIHTNATSPSAWEWRRRSRWPTHSRWPGTRSLCSDAMAPSSI